VAPLAPVPRRHAAHSLPARPARPALEAGQPQEPGAGRRRLQRPERDDLGEPDRQGVRHGGFEIGASAGSPRCSGRTRRRSGRWH
jgi:hypothetical protein